MNDEKITGLEAAKALRVLCPHARQIGALAHYIREYADGNPVPYVSSMAYEHMYDSMAAEYGIRLCSVLRRQCDMENVERFGEHIAMDDVPKFLTIVADADLCDIYDKLIFVKTDIFTLKDMTLYVAAQKKQLTYEYIGFDGDICWRSVTWNDRGFLIPASADHAEQCRNIGAPSLPLTLTGSVPRSIRHRQDAENAQNTINKYLEQNTDVLVGYDEWLQERDPNFLIKKRYMN